ncbi:unnamed protein product [Urochloa humidicola]
MPRGFVPGGDEAVDLWAMAAELERQFAGYKQRLAERDVVTAARAHDDDDTGGGVGNGCVYDDDDDEEEGGRSSISSSSCDVRGRMYEAYVRRRDERLREGWRARMERKEAEVKALWAQLELTAGRAGAAAERAPGGGDPTATTTATAGDESKTERSDDDKRRSSDTALAPRRITGKKHARTRSFSSSMTTSRSRSSDAGVRRALSQEPLPSEPHASADAGKENRRRVRPAAGGAATTTATTARPKTSLRRKNSVKGHGSAKPAAPKLPRSLPRRASSGALDALGGEVVVDLPKADSAAPVQSSSTPGRFVVKDGRSDVTCCEADARVGSPESDHGEVVEAVRDGEEHEEENADVVERREEKADASPDKFGFGNPNGEITASDSETEPSYVYITNKDVIEEQVMTVSEPLKLAGSDDDSNAKTTNEGNGEEMPAPADATAAEIAATNAEEAPARESSADESSFSVRSGLMSARPSCSSRDQSIERLLEADAALLRKKREERAERSTPKTPPGSAGSRVSGGAARSPRETTVRGFKKFLSFGKKNRGREVTVVIDCTSPSVPSLADDDSASGGWQSAGSIKPRMGCSSDAASDDTDHGYPASPRACSLQSLVAASPAKSELAEIVPQEKTPKAHRSFFSFRSLNCGRG